jgi:hypothetical protein
MSCLDYFCWSLLLFFDRVGCVLYFFVCFDFMCYPIGMTIMKDLRDNAGHQSVQRYVNEISLIVQPALQTRLPALFHVTDGGIKTGLVFHGGFERE